MKIVILTIGTFGDVQPYTALGMGLKEAGFDVALAAHACFTEFVSANGLEFRPIAGDPQLWAIGAELGELARAGQDFVSWMRRLRALSKPIMSDILDSCWCACQGAGAIVYSPLAWAGYSIAEKLDIPSFVAALQPMTPSHFFSSVWSPRRLKLGATYNRFTHYLAAQAYWFFNKPFINRWRKDTLTLPLLPNTGPYSQERWRQQPFLYGYSPSVVPKPPDWPGTAHVTGYWHLPLDPAWQPEHRLLDFLGSGSPPVYIGFGSMPDHNPKQLTEIVLASLERTNNRGILQGRWCCIDAGSLPDTGLQNWLGAPQLAFPSHGRCGAPWRCQHGGQCLKGRSPFDSYTICLGPAILGRMYS